MTTAVLKVGPGGALLTEVADAGGEVHDYALELLPPAYGWPWQCRLTRLDSGAGYLVRCAGDGRWACECPDAKYRPERRHSCKHIESCRAVRAVLEAALKPLSVEA